MFNQSSWEWFGHGVCALFEERPLCKPRPLPRLWPGQNKPQVGGEDDGEDGDGVDDGDEDGLGLNWSWSSCTTS